MNELELLKKLGSAAQREDVPEVDVSRKVLSAVTAPQDDWSPSLAWIAGASFAAAVIVASIAFYDLAVWMDPLRDLFFSFGDLTL
ncbi:MAG: hypothetical protein P8182_10355 [Deltaproteobacteria bacterium]